MRPGKTNIPAAVSCLSAIERTISRNVAAWMLIDEFHSSSSATDDLMEAAAECDPITMDEALFLIVVARTLMHAAEDSGDPDYNLRASEKARSALHSVADFMSARGAKVCPLVRRYFMPPSNNPRMQGKEREALLAQDRTEDLARDVFAKLCGGAVTRRRGRGVRS